MKDEKTVACFDTFTPTYPTKRFQFAIDFLAEHARPDQHLIDVGCGDGSVLALVGNALPQLQLAGIDVSTHYLTQAHARSDCSIIAGSILDTTLVDGRLTSQLRGEACDQAQAARQGHHEAEHGDNPAKARIVGMD